MMSWGVLLFIGGGLTVFYGIGKGLLGQCVIDFSRIRACSAWLAV